MSIYTPWRDHLIKLAEDIVVMSFDELFQLVPSMPSSARTYAAWWSNEDLGRTTHVQCKSWQAAGFAAEVDIPRRRVTFVRYARA